MSTSGDYARDERGETLVEILVALMILSVAGLAILAGLELSVKTSDEHRKQTTGGSYVRSYAEAIERYIGADASRYVSCAAADTYDLDTVGLDLPPAFTATQGAALRVSPIGGPASECADDDTGVQQILLTVASEDDRAAEELVVILRRPCDTEASMAVCS